jgi:hypothetical protein
MNELTNKSLNNTLKLQRRSFNHNNEETLNKRKQSSYDSVLSELKEKTTRNCQ